jgi:hypothetical protein
MGPFGIDLGRRYVPNGEERGNKQERRDDENGARREEVAARAHRSGGKTVADRRKAGISSKTFSDGLVSHKPETDGGNRRPQHTARRGVQAGGSEHHRKNRPDRISERADADRRDTEAGNEAFIPDSVHQSTTRNLSRQGDQTRRRQHQADVDLGPFLRGQINRNKGTEPGLNIRDTKDKPVQSPKT